MDDFPYIYAVWHGNPGNPQRTICNCSNRITCEAGILELEQELGSKVLAMHLLDTKERFPYFHDRPSKSTCIKRAIAQIALVSLASFGFFFGAGFLAFGEKHLSRVLASSAAFTSVSALLLSAEALKDYWKEEDEV